MKVPSPADQTAPPPLLVIVGPTAVGKTALSLRLAEEIEGEIISADSRQVYRGMDIGTAKPSKEDQARVRHHLLDILAPDQTLGLAQYQELAYAAIDDVTARHRIPILVGGSGQYVMAVVEGWSVPRVPPDESLRRELEHQAAQHGAGYLHGRLRAVDPIAASRIDPRNVRRVVRALEVCLSSRRPISEQQAKTPPSYCMLILGLTLTRSQLYDRIDTRIDDMIERGLEAEVRRLISEGYGFDRPAMSGLGYGQFQPYFRGEATLDDVIRAMKRATRRFARQQSTWFRTDDPRIYWYDAACDPYSAAATRVKGFLAGEPERDALAAM